MIKDSGKEQSLHTMNSKRERWKEQRQRKRDLERMSSISPYTTFTERLESEPQEEEAVQWCKLCGGRQVDYEGLLCTLCSEKWEAER